MRFATRLPTLFLCCAPLVFAVSATADGRGPRLSQQDVRRLATPVLAAALAPCTVTQLHVQSSLRVPRGELSVTVETAAPRRSGRVPASIAFAVGQTITRLNTSVSVECPAPIVNPGDRVHIVARSGAVRASAPGEAMQPGRVGDLIRVRNTLNGSSVMGRVAADGSVEVELR